ncbi:hypothetical protein Sjap_006238 [Stephania japonica]|uniref:Uncharacterized protein n=1 Tax=Stephania japonica TaxID=461633 RepID=A0AAP0PLT6_9MAGN
MRAEDQLAKMGVLIMSSSHLVRLNTLLAMLICFAVTTNGRSFASTPLPMEVKLTEGTNRASLLTSPPSPVSNPPDHCNHNMNKLMKMCG